MKGSTGVKKAWTKIGVGISFLFIISIMLIFSGAPAFAEIKVIPGYAPSAVLKSGVRYKSFNNGPDKEIYLGKPDLSISTNRVETDAVWQFANNWTFQYDYPTGNIKADVDTFRNQYHLVYNTGNMQSLNYIQVNLNYQAPSGWLLCFNVTLTTYNADGSVATETVIDLLKFVETGTCMITGADLTYGFKIDGYLLFAGTQPSSETNKIELLVGYNSPAKIQVTPPSPIDFGSVNVGSSSAAQTATVTNTGTNGLSIGQITSSSSEFAVTNDQCSNKTVAALGTCTVQVVMTPGYGSQTGELTIPSSDQETPNVYLALTGAGVASDISVAPASPIDFGSVNVGSSSAAQTLTISNTGNTGLTIGEITSTNPEFAILNDLCSNQIVASGGTCSLQMAMTPSFGSRTATLTIRSSDYDTPNTTVVLTGLGLASNIAVVPGSPIDFGSINVDSPSSAQTVTISNGGNIDLSIGPITTSNPEFAIQNDSCSNQTVASGGTCTIQIVMTPSYGSRTATLAIPSSDPDTPNATVALTGVGVASNISVNPGSPIDFGSVNVGSPSAAQTLTISNTGNIGLTIGQISTSNPEFAILNDSCTNQIVAPLGSCPVGVIFTPSSSGTRNGNVNIPSNDVQTPNLTISLTGVGSHQTVTATAGVGGSITPATISVDYGATAEFTVTPDPDYRIAAVSGCNGSLIGQVYTTGPITADCTVTASFYEAPGITTASLASGTVSAAYNQTMAVVGGLAPFTWSVTTGTGILPPGVVLDGSTGVLSGTPTSAGTFTFTIQAADVNNAVASKELSITVYNTLTITTPSLPPATATAVYNQTITMAGGLAPFTWAVTTGAETLPPGVVLDGSTGILSGAPTLAGIFTFTLQVTDANNAVASTELSIRVYPIPAITTTTLAPGTITAAYSQTVFVAEGLAPFTWSIKAGALPGGVTLNASTGVLSGLPAGEGTFVFTIQAEDSNGAVAVQELSMTIYQAPLITTTSLAWATVGTGFSQTMTATGGLTPLTWEITAGNLPAGMTFNTMSGVLSGTPTVSGTIALTIQVSDANSAKTEKPFSLVIYDVLGISTVSLESGTTYLPYTQTLAAAGGKAPYSWSLISGSLPDGLTLTGAGGLISGTPTREGVFNFTVQVTDALNGVTTKALSITTTESSLKPDVAVSMLGVPATGGAGSTIMITDTTINNGQGPAASSKTKFYLSKSTVLDGTAVSLGWRAVPLLVPGGSSAGTTAVVIPLSTSTGSYYIIAKADGDDLITESNEVNNIKYSAVFKIGPDLAVSALNAPTSTGAGQTIPVTDTTKNNGPGASGVSITKFYLSPDASLDSDDQHLSSRAVPVLAAGESSEGTTSMNIPSGTLTGTYYIIAKADADELITEISETNNTKASGQIKIGPDLIVSALTVPANAGAGTSISITDTVKNIGAGDASPSTTNFYLSVDSNLDSGDRTLDGSRSVEALAGGATSQGTTAVAIPDGVESGTYYIIARADGGNAVTELSEQNNTVYRSIKIGPDLTVAAVSVPSGAGSGMTISVTDTTKNNGPGASGVSITKFYLSPDSSLDPEDMYLASRAVPVLAAGESSEGTTSMTIPSGTLTGTYYIIAKADADELITEISETNNTKASGQIKIGPDLIVSALTVPANAGAGTSISITDTVKNTGAGDASPSTTNFYLSVDSNLDSGDRTLDGSRSVEALAGGATSQGTTAVAIPDGVESGTYYIIARADDGNAVTELSEQNNTLYKSILIGPDLTVAAVSVPSGAGSGMTISVTDTTKNNGPGALGASITKFYLSPDSSLDPEDMYLASRALPALAAGESSEGTTSMAIPSGTPTGTYYIVAKADADELITEISEVNNTKASGQIKVGPDLIVSTLTVPASAGAGTSISITDTVKNTGAGEASPSTTNFYLSVDVNLDSGDRTLEGRSVESLVGGATSQGTTAVSIPDGVESGTYYIIARADDGNAVSELSEQNNSLSRSIIIGPDLTVTSVSAPTGAGAGMTIPVTDTTKNNGPGASGVSITKFYLSPDASLDSDDQHLSSRAVPALAAGESSEGTTSMNIPSGTLTGTYYIITKADANELITEISETNNTKASGQIKIGPDLIVSALTVPANAGAGTSISITDTVKNIGAGDASPSTTNFYLSVDSNLDSGDRTLDGSRSVEALAGGATSQGTTAVSIPDGVESGTYYIIAKADGGNAVPELSEDRNTIYRGIKIGPDLSVTTVTVPSITGAGQTISINDAHYNSGPGAAPASITKLYLSPDYSLDPDDLYLASRAVPALAAGESSAGTTSVTIPPGTVTGTFYIIAKADADELITEISETNNAKASGQVKIGPDLAVSTFTVPFSAGAGLDIMVNDAVNNNGAGDAGSSIVRYYLSSDVTLDPIDIVLGSRSVGPLAAEATDQATTPVHIPGSTPAGIYYVIAKADADDLVVETIESNNVKNSAQIRIGPDLTVTVLNAPSSAAVGASISVTDTTRNTGGGNAGSTTTSIYLSLDSTLSPDDLLLGSRSVGPLAAGASDQSSTTIAIPEGTTPDAQYIIAKTDDGNMVPELREDNNTTYRAIQIVP